jgi:hypothetical protein
MHTLPRAVTAQFFINPSAYAALRTHWRTLMTSDRRHRYCQLKLLSGIAVG